jgi:hypothetical protein
MGRDVKIRKWIACCGRAWLAEAVRKQIGESDEGFPARGGVRESAVEAGVED